MMPTWAHLDTMDRELFRVITGFLNNRLEEQGTIDWALNLKPGQRIERTAVKELLSGPGAHVLAEPWATAWRLIEESWSSPISHVRSSSSVYGLQKRLRSGDRSGAIVAGIVDLVSPRLEVEMIASWKWNYMKKRRTPKRVEHVLSARVTSGQLIDLNVLELVQLDDVSFLASLATSLEAAVVRGLDIARRLGWKDERSLLGLGMINRVYYTQTTGHGGAANDPDAYNVGLAPCVKLLHAVVARIAAIQPSSALSFVRRWHASATIVFVRLWAAMARSSELVAVEVVISFLKSTNERQFWDLHTFPEIAELRAVRFAEFDLPSQRQLVARLRKGPPRNHWPKKAEKEKVIIAQQYWAVRELRRIEVAGGVLPSRTKNWLDARRTEFADLQQMALEEGFLEGVTVKNVPPNPDSRYYDLEGVARLKALEAALAESRGGWDDDPANRANDWIHQQGNALMVLADLEATDNGGDDFSRVWNRFGWAHKPALQAGEVDSNTSVATQANRTLHLLKQLSEVTLSSAIEGICDWLNTWKKHVVNSPLALPIWLSLWPIAVMVTNKKSEEIDEANLSVSLSMAENDPGPRDLDTLNTPAGKLVGVFLAACPTLAEETQVFSPGSPERQMRDILSSTGGRSGLIAKHRMIEALPYFLQANRNWAQKHLIEPLRKDDDTALALWRAVARRTHFTEVLKIIGSEMTQRANDRRLDRETRRSIVFSLVIETLHAFRERREPAVTNLRIQQMLRTLDDEMRVSAADAVQQFVRDLSAKNSTSTLEDGEEQEQLATPAVLFREAAAPFLREVWPQERSLATPGVSAALADIPANSGEAFVDAVNTIERFLVPFECWSMIDYGFYGGKEESEALSIIDDEQKAGALLLMLDLTVGTSEGDVVPYDLTDALDQISLVAPKLSESPEFRRLSTLARR